MRREGAKSQHGHMGPDPWVSGAHTGVGKAMEEGGRGSQGLCSVATLKSPHLSDPRGLPQTVLTLGPLVTMSNIGKGVGSKKTRKNQRG